MTPIHASQLDITVTEGDRWRRTLNVTVPADVVEAEKGAITQRLASRMKIKGFRSGKVPPGVVARRYGAAVEREALDHLIRDAYREAVSSQALSPISEGEIEDVSFSPESPLSFKVSFDVRPEITVERLGQFSVQRPSPTVPDDAVDKVMERLREQNATWTTAAEGKPRTGDHVEVALARVDGGEEAAEPRQYEFVLGQGDAIADVEQAIQTLEPGESGEFDVTLPGESGQGESQKLRVALIGRRARELPELTDELARSLGDFEDLAMLRAKVAGDLQKDAERQAETDLRRQLLDLVLDANPFEAPRSMVDGYLDSMIGDGEGVDPGALTELKDRLRPDAERAVKHMLLIDRIAEQEGLRPTEEDVDERVERIAEGVGESPSKVYANLQKSGRLASLEQDLTEEKLFEFLKSQSEITEAH